MGSIELFTTTIAVIFDPIESGPLSGESFQKVMRAPLKVSQGLDGSMVISSGRDQVEVSLLQNKIDVRVIGDKVSGAVTKVPEVLLGLVEVLPPLRMRSYGINFLLESNLEQDGTAWVGEKFLSESLRELGPRLSSDSIKFSFDNPPKVQTVVLQINNMTRLIVTANASEPVSDLPTKERLGDEIDSQYEFVTELLRKWGLT